MKKHILGLALFTFIVTAAIFVKAVLFVPEVAERSIEDVTFVINGEKVYEKTSCWRTSKNANTAEKPMVKQAVLNLNTKQIDWGIYVPKPGSQVALHFFIKDSKYTSYLGTEIAPAVGSSDSNFLVYNSTYTSLYNLKSFENLYVVPEMISRTDSEITFFNPKFDEYRATPVTVYSGKNNY